MTTAKVKTISGASHVLLVGARSMTLKVFEGHDSERRARAYTNAVNDCLNGTPESSKQTMMSFDNRKQGFLF